MSAWTTTPSSFPVWATPGTGLTARNRTRGHPRAAALLAAGRFAGRLRLGLCSVLLCFLAGRLLGAGFVFGLILPALIANDTGSADLLFGRLGHGHSLPFRRNREAVGFGSELG